MLYLTLTRLFCLSMKVSFSVVLKVRWTSLKVLEALQTFTASRMNSNGTLLWRNSGGWTGDDFYWCWQCQGHCIYPDPTSHWRTQSLVTKGHISLICFRSLILQKVNWPINGRPLISHVNTRAVCNWVKWSCELRTFPAGKNSTISMAFPWMFCSFRALTILHSEAWQHEFR